MSKPESLPTFTVKNFTDYDVLKVEARDYTDYASIGKPLVMLQAGGNSCSFHHSMTPEQARALAVYLNECADALEAISEGVWTGEPA